jgi:hypothetical protein
MRLTKDIRNNIHRKAIANVPSIDYHVLLIPLIQGVLCDHMPDHVRRAYDDPAQRAYLKTSNVYVKVGNKDVYIKRLVENRYFQNHEFHGFVTLDHHGIAIRHDAAAFAHLKAGTLSHDLSKVVIESGYIIKHLEQQELLESVKRRLRDTLESVNTIKRLYDVLEPELHHLIPKEGDKTANLPATAAPVVEDLRRLGAQLPNVPKMSA